MAAEASIGHSAVEVATDADLAKHNGRHLVQVDGRHVALIEHLGELHAIDATCYHMGGPLLHADIEDSAEFGPCVVCPWHRYPISLKTGDSTYHNMQGVSCSKGVKQRVHEVERRDGRVYVKLLADERDGAPAKIDSDTYAFKPPPPSGGGGIGGGGGAPNPHGVRSGGVVRSGQVLNRGAGGNGSWLARGSGGAAPPARAGSGGKDVARSMCGGDGRAPWASGSMSSHAPPAPLPPGYTQFIVQSRRPIASDTVELTVSGDLPGEASSWTSGSHLMARVGADERAYTPYRRPGERGQFQLLVKNYPSGALSPKLARLAPGATLLLKGPLSGAPPLDASASRPTAFVVGGTGVTPALQMLFAMAEAGAAATPQAPIHVLCYGSRPEDLYLRTELEALVGRIPQLRLHFSATELTEAQKGTWRGGEGRPIADALREHLPPADSDARVFWCGPPPFNNAVRGLLGQLGYTDDQVHEFS